MANFRISTNDGRFLTLLANNGPVTAEADNPGALNQIWNIPNFANNNSTVQNLGYAAPMPFAVLVPPAGVSGGQAPLAWNFVGVGGNNFIQEVGTNLTWRVGVGNGGMVALTPANFVDPAQQLAVAQVVRQHYGDIIEESW
ncbi:hypothetical protein BU15DRAFT_64373 [Melanogaster broomeanus]|nr:hypothetical protein BU15DRAFT_64373 [Melanogaster broomeanus]